MKIGLACDHAGFEYKEKLKEFLSSKSNDINDYGCYSLDSVDYPDFAHKLTKEVLKNKNSVGILICGTGQGMAITANKQVGIRAALCYEPEIAELSRSHNDCNVLTLGARFIDSKVAIECILKFINTPFEGGRHQNRIDKI